MSAREKVSCFDCDIEILLKNLKVHYGRFHPDKPVKHRSINETSIAKFFSTSTLKRKAEEENIDEISTKKQDLGGPEKSFETIAPLDEHLENSSNENHSSSIDENNNENADTVSVDKNILNQILSSIQGKSFFNVFY